MTKPDIEIFREKAMAIAPDACMSIDLADSAEGSHWMNVAFSRNNIELEFKGKDNICFYLNEEGNYGEMPDEICNGIDLALHRFAQIYGRSKANLNFNGINAVELRKLQFASQKSVADKMHVSQASISQFESRLLHKDAFKISTLKQYVESLGGTIEVNLIFPHFRGSLEFGSGANDYEKFLPDGILAPAVKTKMNEIA